MLTTIAQQAAAAWEASRHQRRATTDSLTGFFLRDYFAEKPYEGTDDCLNCHGPMGEDIITTGHWNWQGVALGIEGLEGEIHGKTDIINT